MDSVIQKFKSLFLDEAQEIINSYESDLLKLELDPNNLEIIESAFRKMHTLKGTSGMYGFEYVSEITHKLESIFQQIRDKKLTFNKEIFEITFSVIDHLRKLLIDEGMNDNSLKDEHQKLIQIIDKSCSIDYLDNLNSDNIKAGIKKQSIWYIKLKTTEKQYYRGISFMNIFRELAEIGIYTIERILPAKDNKEEEWGITLLTSSNEDNIREIFMFIEDDCSFKLLANFCDTELNGQKEDNVENLNKELSILEAVSSANLSPVKSKENIVTPVKTGSHEMKRISVTALKLDHLMFLVSELITINSQVSLSLKNNNIESLKIQLEKIDTLSKNFRNNALELRLVPLNDLALRFQRLIRDLSKQLNKKVEFQISGAECELDKSTIEQLSDPLMHIIRNCMDHGIETPEVRISQGKPEMGLIKLSAYQSGGKIVIVIEDDGNGIDLNKVKNKAIHLGLINHDVQISKKELIDLIFKPGFSTAQNLTNISGRGVGMDIVKKKIQDLQGSVTIETKEKIGTSFTITIQQSISIVDTLLFKIEHSFFTIPLSDINICIETQYSDIILRKYTSTIPFGEKLIPFVDLRNVLELGGEYPTKVKLIIIKCEECACAILVDRIIGEHQAVLKPINKSLQKNTFLGSVSQMGDGNMAFMIDTHEMINKIKVNENK